jgi:uncharacterized protein YjbI with pentapeptide repeats
MAGPIRRRVPGRVCRRHDPAAGPVPAPAGTLRFASRRFPSVADRINVLAQKALAPHVNEETEAAFPQGLEEAPEGPPSAAPIGSSGRRHWRPEELRGADLRGQDLRNVEGLLPEHLAGAVLTGARLPDDLGRFEALGQVAAISSEARKIFIGLLAACVYSWLVIGTTKDVALILNTSSSPLPIINAPIPITGFYVVGATLLAAIYCYFHFYLQPLWRALATLPAVFRDGVAQDDKTDPWQLTNLVRTEFPQLRATAPPLARLENRLSIVLAWWLVPVTLFALWARYLPAHDISGLTWLAFLIGATTFFGRHTFRLARATLRGEMPLAGTTPPGGPPPTVMRRILRELPRLRGGQITIWFLLPFLIMVGLSISASVQSPRAADGSVGVFSLGAPAQVLRKIDPTPAKLLNFVSVRTYADLREAEVTPRPQAWDGRNWGEVKRVDLRGRDLAFADATSAFLANADLRGATLTGAQFGFAQLQGADLTAAQLQGAVLWHAQLHGALLTKARLQGGRLTSANLEGANLSSAGLWSANLSRANLQGASLQGAQLQGADLRYGQLQGADLNDAQLQGAQLGSANLQGASLRGVNLQGADLRDAQLLGADLRQARLQGADLRQARLQGADLRGTRIWRARGNDALWDFADVRASSVQEMTKSDIDALIGAATKGIADEDGRKARTKTITAMLQIENSPGSGFPEPWRSEPNVMFETGDPRPEPFTWGRPNWDTEQAYDEDLAAFLGDLACGRDAPAAQTHGLARRALEPARPEGGEPDRLWPRLFAARVVGPACPPAEMLPDDMRRQLEQLAAQGDPAVASPDPLRPMPSNEAP